MPICWLVRSRVQRLSECLVVSGVREEEEQRHCLELGKEAGLDIGMVTKAVVENIRSTGLVGVMAL